MSYSDRLAQVNARLKGDGYRVRITENRGRLLLQATLPPAPGSTKSRPFQQKISLKLAAAPSNLRAAEKAARKLGQQLLDGNFAWADWREVPTPATDPAFVWIEKFEQNYFARRARTPKSETTWRTDYQCAFAKLDPLAPLTEQSIIAAILTTNPDTRTRKRTCRCLAALAKFAGLETGLKIYEGNYGPASVTPRTIPSDSEILSVIEGIPNDKWRWIFGLIAAYGLRPHEVYHAQWSRYPRLEIRAGKTGRRICFPNPPDWPDRLNLKSGKPISSQAKSNGDLGHLVTVAARRYNLPWPPYALRHAFAVRCIGQFDLPIAARLMGHSVRVHTETYQRWLGDADLDLAWRNLNPKPIA